MAAESKLWSYHPKSASQAKGWQFQTLRCRSPEFNLLPVLPGRLIHSRPTPRVVMRLGASTSAPTVRCMPPGFRIAPARFRLVFGCRCAICAMPPTRPRFPRFLNFIKRLLRFFSSCPTPNRLSARWRRSHARCFISLAVRCGRGCLAGLRLLHRNLQRQA